MTSKVTWDATREVTREVNTSSSSSHISEIAITTIKATIAIGEMLPFAAAACQIAKKIVEMVETAQRHKEVCKDLSERIKRTTKRIEANPPTKDSSIMIQVSYQSYKQILDEASQYIRDLIKPGTFSQKTLRRIKSLVKSKDMLEYHADLIGRLDAAIQDLQLDLAFDTNKKVNELTVKMDQNLDISHENLDYARETSFEVKKMAAKMEVVSNFAQLAMLTKGADFKEESIYVDPSSVEEDDDDPVIRGKTKRIKKMLFNGKDEVAVRKVQPSDKHKALRQAMILNRLGACKNIESFKGLMKKSEEIYVVTEWTENYDLEKYLHSNVEISLKQKLKFAEGIAAALTYCHKADIFHHDVKSANILIDEDLNVKLSNFDLARFSNETTTSLSGQMKSIRWTAPEKLNITYVAYSKEMDVYSFAIVMWEIAARKEPFYQISNNIEVSEKIKKGDRPSPIPDDIMPEYQRIMELGWAQSFRFRPTMQAITHELHMLYKKNKSQFPGLHRDSFSTSASSLNTLSPSEWTPSEHTEFDFKTKYEEIKQIQPEKSHTLPPWKDVTTAISKKNYEEAIEGLELYTKSDAKEAYLARYYAGKLLFEGHDGVPQDEFQAMIYLREAADHLPASSFTPLAQYLYADICLRGTHYDQENGIKYLKMAVRASEKNALFLYGNILFNGEHGEQINSAKAEEMLKLSRSRGNERAGEMLKRIEAAKAQAAKKAAAQNF